MNKYNFGEYNSKEKLLTLLNNFNDFKLDETDSSKALNLSSDAWHLTDFVFEEYKPELGFQTLGDFRNDLFAQCDNLKIMHDLANASKHYNLSRPKAQIKLTRKHSGDFSSGFSKDFDISHLEIILENDEKLDFLLIIKNVIEFWKKFFNKNLNIIL
ncbi:hypothetical protein [Chishuiella sp.]|uniref:hypothetical protein n=1 Tax=Chishuiella sp. TaxID=1969467 RepID=UPI0028AD52A0|nr:hypothetical protein [Chishuiella sp.]